MASEPYHETLEEHEQQRRHDREGHDAQADGGMGDRMGRDQSVGRLDQQKHRRTGYERRLAERRQRFRLAVAEAVLAIGRCQRMTDGQQVDHRCRRIEQRVEQRRQQAD